MPSPAQGWYTTPAPHPLMSSTAMRQTTTTQTSETKLQPTMCTYTSTYMSTAGAEPKCKTPRPGPQTRHACTHLRTQTCQRKRSRSILNKPNNIGELKLREQGPPTRAKRWVNILTGQLTSSRPCQVDPTPTDVPLTPSMSTWDGPGCHNKICKPQDFKPGRGCSL